MIQALIVFVAFVILDVVYALYTLAVAHRRIGEAVLWAAMIPALSAYIVTAYIDNAWMVVPACMGAAVGTWLVVRFWK